MRPRFQSAVLCLVICVAGFADAQKSVSGDIWRWLPVADGGNGKEAQIARNAQYVSIKIEAAHVSYKSGFLENIRSIVVSSSVAFDLGTRKLEALSVNRT